MLNRANLNEQHTTGTGLQSGIEHSQGLHEDVKEEPQSPIDDGENEMQNADVDCEEDANTKTFAISKRRTAHTVAEQKRRDAIKKGYDDLQTIVPTCLNDDSPGAPKISKAVILQKTIDYLRNILEEKQEKENELNSLKKEVLALQIMKANYEDLAKSTQIQTSTSSGNTVSDEVKFGLFKRIMETQFHSFNDAACTTSFDALSASIFKWLEEECKPQKLQKIVQNALGSTNIHGV